MKTYVALTDGRTLCESAGKTAFSILISNAKLVNRTKTNGNDRHMHVYTNMSLITLT